jgi:Helix-turn-helix domain
VKRREQNLRGKANEVSVRVMGAVFALDIAASEKLVLLAMADHARDDGTGCYPSIELLARKTSQSRRGVQKIMRRLEDFGLIAPSKVSRGGPRRSTEYTLTLANSEPRSLFASTQPRTPVHETANPGAPNRERQCIKPRTRFARTIKNHQEPSGNPAAAKPPLGLDPRKPKSVSAAKPAAGSPDPPGFERFWKTYPRKLDKQDARKAWDKAALELFADLICAGVEAWKSSWDDERFIPHPTTFLKKRRWEAEPPTRTITVNEARVGAQREIPVREISEQEKADLARIEREVHWWDELEQGNLQASGDVIEWAKRKLAELERCMRDDPRFPKNDRRPGLLKNFLKGALAA